MNDILQNRIDPRSGRVTMYGPNGQKIKAAPIDAKEMLARGFGFQPVADGQVAQAEAVAPAKPESAVATKSSAEPATESSDVNTVINLSEMGKTEIVAWLSDLSEKGVEAASQINTNQNVRALRQDPALIALVAEQQAA